MTGIGADPGLDRFVTAQEGVYAGVLDELRRGRKTGHWIWFIFPQIAGLGRSDVSRFYSIASLDEARAYLAHPVLGRSIDRMRDDRGRHRGPHGDRDLRRRSTR